MTLGMARTMQQECFGNAFLHAISAVVGCSLSKPEPDNDSIDWTVSCRLPPRRPKLDIQMKCTEMRTWRSDSVQYALKRKNYDELIVTDVLVPRILVLVAVPDAIEEWLMPTREQFVMRHCAYWISLMGLPQTENQSSVTISIPRDNLFTVGTLVEMMHRINYGSAP